MKVIKAKIFMIVLLLISIMFFSNDFGIIDIEKTAIITAIAVDYNYEQKEYEVTCEIAVPEATDTNSENLKTEVSAKGKTVGKAIKQIGAESGWYPQLYFCNLIIMGENIANENSIKVLDFFAKTLRIQDSAEIVMSKGNAKDVFKGSSPLDNISSFAIQKILLKSQGFDSDIVNMNIKNFNIDYHNRNSSSLMPILITKTQSGGSENHMSSGGGGEGQGGESSSSEKTFFDASSTALFKNGVKVGELEKNESLMFNMLTKSIVGSGFTLTLNEGQKENNYLLIVYDNSAKLDLNCNDEGIKLNVELNVNFDISDQTDVGEDLTYAKNLPLPKKVKDGIEEKLKREISSLIEKSLSSGCDFLKLDDKLYRYCHKYYDKYKNNFLSNLTYEVKVNAHGQQ